jgi:flagellar basal body-associated protein FliL
MNNESGKVNLIVVAIIIVVQLLLAAGVYFLFFSAPSEVQPTMTAIERTDVDVFIPRPTEARNEPTSERNRPAGSSMWEVGGGVAKDYLKDYTIFQLGDIVVNPTLTTDENRFFVVSVSFEYRRADRKLPDELKQKSPLFRDGVMGYFSRLTVDDLRNFENREIFKEDLMRMMNNLLVEGRITDVFFEQFVLQ